MSQQAGWTNPFYGTQHLRGLRRGFQITVVDRGAVSECKVYVPGGGFTSKNTLHRCVEDARAHAVSQALGLDAFAIGALA